QHNIPKINICLPYILFIKLLCLPKMHCSETSGLIFLLRNVHLDGSCYDNLA
ncbi:hypothetical protein ACJMK2_032397, partial [Sinanodonta woodiana]